MSYDLLRFSLLFRRFVISEIERKFSAPSLRASPHEHSFIFATPHPNSFKLPKSFTLVDQTPQFLKSARICAGFIVFSTLLYYFVRVSYVLNQSCSMPNPCGFRTYLCCQVFLCWFSSIPKFLTAKRHGPPGLQSFLAAAVLSTPFPF